MCEVRCTLLCCPPLSCSVPCRISLPIFLLQTKGHTKDFRFQCKQPKWLLLSLGRPNTWKTMKSGTVSSLVLFTDSILAPGGPACTWRPGRLEPGHGEGRTGRHYTCDRADGCVAMFDNNQAGQVHGRSSAPSCTYNVPVLAVTRCPAILCNSALTAALLHSVGTRLVLRVKYCTPVGASHYICLHHTTLYHSPLTTLAPTGRGEAAATAGASAEFPGTWQSYTVLYLHSTCVYHPTH